jgi:hypothetical protein
MLRLEVVSDQGLLSSFLKILQTPASLRIS